MDLTSGCSDFYWLVDFWELSSILPFSGYKVICPNFIQEFELSDYEIICTSSLLSLVLY